MMDILKALSTTGAVQLKSCQNMPTVTALSWFNLSQTNKLILLATDGYTLGNKTMIKLSKANKMPCKSWSLQAIDTCPASKDNNGDLVPACQGCYATTGNYRFPNVKAPREHNREDWKRDAWVSDMIDELDTERYFRWFDSGDVYDIRLADKILAVMIATPWVKHWLPTRMHKFSKFAPVLAKMGALDNVVVRLSSDSITGETIDAPNSSTIIPTISHALPTMSVCDAYEREGKCAKCRKCWDKTISVVAYPAHGKKMLKQVNQILAINL
jgi:hypothetical protein